MSWTCCQGEESKEKNEDVAAEDATKSFEKEILARWEKADRLARKAIDKMRGTIGSAVSEDAKFRALVKITIFFYQKLEWEDFGDKPSA